MFWQFESGHVDNEWEMPDKPNYKFHLVNDIIFRTRKKIIQAYHVVTFVYKPSTEMRAYKTGSATYQYSFHSKYFYCLLKRRCLFVLFMVTNVTDLLKINNFRRGYFKKKQI